jgi:D-inositol-3-phosphate glycosyltransferase
VDGHEPADWARVLTGLLASPRHRARLGIGAVAHARGFSWDRTASGLLTAYRSALSDFHTQRLQDLDPVRPRIALDGARR